MTSRIIIAELAIIATAADVTDAQIKGIESAITRVARRAESSAARRGIAPYRAIEDAVSALVGFGNKLHGARVSVSFAKA